MKSPLEPSSDEGRKWPQVLAAASVTIAVFSTGFHTGWPAPSLPKLLSEDFPFEVTKDEASYITIIGHVGNICGGLFGTAVIDRIGRRWTILSIAVPHLLSFFLIIMSYYILELLYVGRYIGGVAEGMTFTIIPLYIAEIAHPSIRGTLGTFITLACICGMLYVNVVGSILTIKDTAMTFLIFPVIFLISFWKMPETPYFLLMKNRQEEAEKSLKFLRRKNNVDEELSSLKQDVKRQMSESGTYRDIFRIDSNRKAFLVMMFARLFHQFTGISAFSLYIQILLKEATDSITPELGASILLVVQLAMAFLSTFIVDKLGRKPLLLISIGGCFIDLLFQTIYFALKEYTTVDLSIIDWFPLVMMALFVIFFSGGLAVAVQIMNGEIFSQSIKSKSVSLINVIFALSMLSTTKFYQATADNYGLTVPFVSFTICTFFAVLFFYYYVPETKGKTLEEIQQVLKGNKRESTNIDNKEKSCKN